VSPGPQRLYDALPPIASHHYDERLPSTYAANRVKTAPFAGNPRKIVPFAKVKWPPADSVT
jgi:hypothetical protein